MFEQLKINLTARKAYTAHVSGNQLIDKGQVAEAKEKHDEALRLYEEAYKGGVRDSKILMAYAVLLMRYDRSEEARDLLLMCENDKGLDAASRKQMRVNFAVCQWKLGELDKAIENMEIAGSNGKTSMMYVTLGYFYVEKGRQTGDFSKAEEFNREALEYDDEDAGILDNVAQMHYFIGDHDAAYEWFAKAYRQKTTQVATCYYIAKINLERGNLEKAKGFIDKCLQGNFSALATITRADAQKLKEEIEAAAK